MQVIYELTQRDFFDSLIAHRNRSAVAKWSLRVVLSFFLLMVAAGVFLLVVEPTSQTLSSVAPLMVLAAIWALVIWALPWWQARNQFSKQPSAHGPRTLVVDTGGVHWRWDGGSSDIEWKQFTRYLEAKDLFLLYTSPAAIQMIPKRAFTAEQLSEFRSLLAERVSSKQAVAVPAKV